MAAYPIYWINVSNEEIPLKGEWDNGGRQKLLEFLIVSS